MVLLHEEAQVEAHFGPFGDNVSVGPRYVYGLCQTYNRLRNHFGCTQWNSSVTWVIWNLVSVCLVIALLFVQDRSTVFAKHVIGSKIILDAPDGTPT